jgi:uncharacterized protein (TIGR00299 family) protein
MSERVAWFHCAAGVAGDMTLAALVDAGADPAIVADVLGGLGVDGWALTFERTQRCGVGAMRALIAVDDHPLATGDHHPHHPHRPVGDILAMLRGADIPGRVRHRATRVVTALAEVEAAIHGVDPAHVELHEVGALDAIVDIVGACAALESLAIDRVITGPIAVGTGRVRTAHGVLPNPSPAAVAMLARFGAPSVGVDDPLELATPTGVAIVCSLADGFGPMPPMTPTAVGYGAGSADTPGRPNVVQVVVGHGAPARSLTPGDGLDATHLQANVDDVTPEVLAHAVDQLLAAGAFDAWITPIVMKKGRPAHTVHALCDPARRDEVAAALIRETGTLGLRAGTVQRWPQRRTERVVLIDGHEIRTKVSDGRVKVEHDDAARAAEALGVPLRDVLARAADEGSGQR